MNDTVTGGNVSLSDRRAIYHNAATRASNVKRAALNRSNGRGSHRCNICASDAARKQVILQHLRQLGRVLQKSIQLVLRQLRESGIGRREQRERSSTT